MKELNLLIKPSGVYCNLACSYCFNKTMAKERKLNNDGFMNLTTMMTIIDQVVAAKFTKINFIFQGGEPTLLGLEFYQTIVAYQKNFDITFTNSFQTNGVLIDKQWIDFFQKEEFLIGISLDGTEKLHNLNRFDARQKGSYNQVINCLEKLQLANLNYNVITVISKDNVKSIEQIYNHFKSLNIKFMQFIPCLDDHDLMVTNDEYGEFLNHLYKLWYNDLINGNYISIREFDNFINLAINLPADACAMNGTCQKYFVVQPNGDFYPCDFYVKDAYFLGNINKDLLTTILNSQMHEKFIKNSKSVNDKCQNCQWYNLCKNNCQKNRLNNQYQYCEAMDIFFTANASSIKELAINLFNNLF